MSETVTRAENEVTIEIDGVELAAPKGSMIIEAADKAGITIPRFCYHQKLSVAANCRMCLVDVEKAPKPLPACATPVMDGMKVYTQSKRAVSAQQNVMEFLLINHPLDCPICDQGGECELQDVSMGFGRSISRFTERKRVVKDENLGSLISTEMTRCIHCTRCVRFLEEIAGTNELGGIGRGDRTMISTFIGRSIDSELSGNIIDLCPVGALTNKPFRFTARAWELRSKASVASHDAIGSKLYYHLRRGEIMRAVPRDDEAVNESWLADRDRWGFHGLKSDDRATTPQVRGADGAWQDASWAEAIDHAAGLLRSVDGDQLGFLLSGRSTTEELYLAQKIARGLGSENIDHRLRQRDFDDQDEVGLAPTFERPLRAIAESDVILVVGCNLRHEAPLLGHQVRQAARKGARVFVLNPADYGFNFDLAGERVVRPSALPAELAAIAAAAGVEGLGGAEDVAAAAAMASGDQVTIVLGQGVAHHARASELRRLARALGDKVGAAVCALPSEPNAIGAWMAGAVPHRGPAGQGRDAPGLSLAGMTASPREVYFTLDLEPGLDDAYGAALNAALAGAQVIHLGSRVTPDVLDIADVILPLAPAPESAGTFTNVDGRHHRFEEAGAAPGDARAGWKVLRVLGDALALEGFAYTRIDQIRDEVEALLEGAEREPAAVRGPESVSAAKSELELLAELPLYATDGLVRRSEPLQNTVHGETAAVTLHSETAAELGLEPGDAVAVTVADETFELPAAVRDSIAPGVARLAMGIVVANYAADAVSLARPDEEASS